MSHTPTLRRLVYVIPQVYAYNIGDEQRAHTGFDSVLIKVEQAPVLVLILVGAGIARELSHASQPSLMGTESVPR